MDQQLLFRIRNAKGLTQEQVAELLGIERSYYSRIENGLRPSVKVAKKIAETFDLKWTIFFESSCEINSQNDATA